MFDQNLSDKVSATEPKVMDWAAANAAGRASADALVAEIRRTGQANRLGPAIRAIIERGVYGGEEVGFCHRIGAYLAE